MIAFIERHLLALYLIAYVGGLGAMYVILHLTECHRVRHKPGAEYERRFVWLWSVLWPATFVLMWIASAIALPRLWRESVHDGQPRWCRVWSFLYNPRIRRGVNPSDGSTWWQCSWCHEGKRTMPNGQLNADWCRQQHEVAL